MKLSQKQIFWLLLAVCILTLIPFLGLYDYNTKGEPRESIVSFSMIDSGNWILPRNNGGEMAYKPPFFHWTVAICSYIWGTVTEATSRFPSALALIALIMSGFSFFAKRKGITVSLMTALLCLTSMELHRAGGNCRVDMVLTALSVGAMYLLYRWWEKGMKGFPLSAILLMSAGVLTKGPVGALIPCMVMGAFLLMKRVNFWKAFFSQILFVILSFIIPAVWYYAAWKQGGQEFYDLMFEENIGRMTNTMAYDSCVEPWPYNILTLIYGFLPFTFLLLISLCSLKGVKTRISTSFKGMPWVEKGKKLWSDILAMENVELFSLVAAIVIFVFYCIPQSKRSVYLMPMYPFTAYFIAKYMIWLADNKKNVLKVYGYILCVVTLILVVATFVLKLHVVPETIFHGRHAVDNIATLHGLENIGGIMAYLSVFIAAAGSIWWIKYCMSNTTVGQGHLFAIMLLILCTYIGVDGAWKPAALNAKSQKPVAAIVDKLCPASYGHTYEYMEASVQAKGDPPHFFELNFYIKRPNTILSFHKEKPQKGFLLISNDDYDLRRADFEREGYKMTVLHETRQNVCGKPLEIIKFCK